MQFFSYEPSRILTIHIPREWVFPGESIPVSLISSFLHGPELFKFAVEGFQNFDRPGPVKKVISAFGRLGKKLPNLALIISAIDHIYLMIYIVDVLFRRD